MALAEPVLGDTRRTHGHQPLAAPPSRHADDSLSFQYPGGKITPISAGICCQAGGMHGDRGQSLSATDGSYHVQPQLVITNNLLAGTTFKKFYVFAEKKLLVDE